jgi:chemotaxis protein CheX
MNDKYVPVRAEHINPFLSASVNVFRTMLDCELTRGQVFVKGTVQPSHHISGIIGLSGKAAGIVVLSLSREVALRATEQLTQERPTEINTDVVDAIGELANMIAGSAKAQLAQYEMSISLPSVIIGHNHTVSFPKEAKPIAIPFDCKWGSVCVEVGLCELSA